MSREVALATHVVGPLRFNVCEVTVTDEQLASARSRAKTALRAQRGVNTQNFFATLISDASGSKPFALVSEVDGITVGFALGYVVGTRCIITALYVEEKCRSLGIGAQLLSCARSFNATARETLVCVLPGQRELKNLCEQAGLPAQVIFAGTP
jgi:GNAT superfamily N-acetyltransferase